MNDSTPTIRTLDKSFAIVRRVQGERQWWNGTQGRWIPERELHGPSARNPKASYYRTREAAAFELTLIARCLTPEAAASERRARARENARRLRTARTSGQVEQ